MKKWLVAAAAAIGFVGPANGAVVALQTVITNSANDFVFSYQSTLGPDEGLRTGDKFVIFDFNGYVEGSVRSSSSLFVASSEAFTADAIVTPGFDDANIANLVFTYVGTDFRNDGGPYNAISFDAFSARSTFGGRTEDAFYTRTTKNNPDGRPGGSNTYAYTLGVVAVPTAGNTPDAIPEPATWAMLVGGFGMLGAAVRRPSRMPAALA